MSWENFRICLTVPSSLKTLFFGCSHHCSVFLRHEERTLLKLRRIFKRSTATTCRIRERMKICFAFFSRIFFSESWDLLWSDSFQVFGLRKAEISVQWFIIISDVPSCSSPRVYIYLFFRPSGARKILFNPFPARSSFGCRCSTVKWQSNVYTRSQEWRNVVFNKHASHRHHFHVVSWMQARPTLRI